MKSSIMVFCGLLAGWVLTTAAGAQDAVSKRMKDGQPTVIQVGDGATISIPAGLLTVEQSRAGYEDLSDEGIQFSYKEGSGSPFGVTVLATGVKGGISVGTAETKDHSPKAEIVSSGIEVETALTEICDTYVIPDSEYIAWEMLYNMLKTAPHSPRVKIVWGDMTGNGYFSTKLVYDRRTRNLWYWRQFGGANEDIVIEQHVEKGILEEEIAKRCLLGHRWNEMWPHRRLSARRLLTKVLPLKKRNVRAFGRG